jgi:hypothetical protein
VPLPRLTLLFPVLSPTPTASRTTTPTPVPVLLAVEAAPEERAAGPDLQLLGGLILLLWLVLGSFLVVYLRRVGY